MDKYYELLLEEKYNLIIDEVKELLDNDNENSELWYLLFLASNNNYINYSNDNIKNEIAFNKAIEYSDILNEIRYKTENYLYSNLGILPDFDKLFRSYQFNKYDECINILDSINKKYQINLSNKLLDCIKYIFNNPKTITEFNIQLRIYDLLYNYSNNEKIKDIINEIENNHVYILLKNNKNTSINNSGLENRIYKRIGNKIYFGSYYINNNLSKEPIEWDILEERNGKALIISHFILDSNMYDIEANNYEKSFIRNWLNNEFYDFAFTYDEKELINYTYVDNSLDSVFNDNYIIQKTKDKLFLLSYKEAEELFTSNSNRVTVGTAYAISRGLWVSDNKSTLGKSSWWLRTPYKYTNEYAFNVDNNGYIDFHSEITSKIYGIRPALWIKL